MMTKRSLDGGQPIKCQTKAKSLKVFSTQTAKIQRVNDNDPVKLHWKKP